MTIITTSVNTTMYAGIAVTIFLKLVRVDLWKKITTASLTAPEYFGYVLWLTNDSDTNRKVYLYCQYFSFFGLAAAGVYHFVELMFEYFVYHDRVTENELAITGSFIVGFGVLGVFFLMLFQDYIAEMHHARKYEVEIETEINKPSATDNEGQSESSFNE